MGAKSCAIEITEAKQDATSQNISSNVGGKIGSLGKFGIKADSATGSANSQMHSGKITAVFKDSIAPQRPALKWFASDENIKNLIEMRCSTPGRLEREEIFLSGSTVATMTHNAAIAIDGLKGIKGGVSMKSQASTEHSSTLIFSVEF